MRCGASIPTAAGDEDAMLAAFDRHRTRIYQAAAKVYSRGKGFYELDARDF